MNHFAKSLEYQVMTGLEWLSRQFAQKLDHEESSSETGGKKLDMDSLIKLHDEFLDACLGTCFSDGKARNSLRAKILTILQYMLEFRDICNRYLLTKDISVRLSHAKERTEGDS